MISLKPIQDRLQKKPDGFEHAWFREIGAVTEFAEIGKEHLPLPMAWVVRTYEKARAVGELEDDVKVTFAVVIAIENIRVKAKRSTDDVLLDYRRGVYRLLRGWGLPERSDPINYDGGNIFSLTENDIYWRDNYSAAGLINNYLPDPPEYSGLNRTGDNL